MSASSTRSDAPDPTVPQRILVACLCAEWCTACRAYRAVFDQEASAHAGLRFLWVDVEDSAALLDGIDVENFPTILIGQGARPTFFGAITPQREVLQRVIAAHLRDSMSGDALGPEIGDLLRRLQGAALQS